MRKYAPVAGAFALGALSMFLLLGIYTSTVVQRVFAQANPTPPPSLPKPSPIPALPGEDPDITALRQQFGGAVFSSPKAEPKVPDVLIQVGNMAIPAGVQQLDGLDCNGCRFDVSILT
jgi:hypothetical protein